MGYKIQGDSVPLIPFPVLPGEPLSWGTKSKGIPFRWFRSPFSLSSSVYRGTKVLGPTWGKKYFSFISRRFGRIQASLEKKYFWNFLPRVSSLSRGAKFSNFRSWNFIFTSVVPVSRWDSDENRKVLLAQILLLHNFLQVSALSRGRMTEIGICSLLPCSRYENRRKYFYKCPPFLEVGFGRIWVLGRFDLLKQPGLANNIDFGYFSGKWKFNFFDFKLI